MSGVIVHSPPANGNVLCPYKGRGSKVETLPPGEPSWCQPAVWGTLVSWKDGNTAVIEIETGTTLLIRANVASRSRRYMLVDAWWTDEVVGNKDIINIEFKAKGIEPNCFLAPAADWLVNNFPQEPIHLDGKDWIVLSQDDMAIATLANPRLGASPFALDAAAVYAPYIPLQMKVADPAHQPVVFNTRYDVTP